MGHEAVSGYELVDHTADLGVRVFAPTRAALIAPSTAGFYATIGDVHPGVHDATAPRTFEFSGDDDAVLLRDYLAELLVLFETQRRMLVEAHAAEFTASVLRVSGREQTIDWAQSALDREVKAVTYHELMVRQTAQGFEAFFLVDI
jgi:SHS2 domain-containing protein